MRQFLEGRGEIGRDLLEVDWDATPLGQPEDWPNALRTSVRILLTSKFSMWMAWGPELTFFCNDAYRRDTLGKKYPWALGKPASEVWSEIWDDISPRIERVMRTGEATWDESLQLFLERSGYVEETYHTFSYSPLAADDGRVAGMLCVVKEDTEEVIAVRRMATLRDLATRGSGLSEAQALESACTHLAANPHSLPFTLVYLFDADGRTAMRAGSTGFGEGSHPAAPATMVVGDPDAAWPVDRLALGGAVEVDGLDQRFPDLPCGAWDEPPLRARLVPLLQPTQAEPYGFLVAGLNRFRPLDADYRSFLDLIAGHLAATITDARAFDFERQRAETLAQLDQAKTDFFTNVSHEFRTPLTLLLGPAQDALADEREPLPPEQRRRVEVVLRNGQRLLKLVNSLLDFSRLESGHTAPRLERIDLAHHTRDLAGMFESAAARAGLTLTVDCPPLPAPVAMDPDHWAKIVLNLVSNALKFTFEGGITVTLRERGGRAVLTVADTGTGIPEAEQAHLFDRFHRVHGARARTHEGSGIGLALVAELAALHGGTVSVESTVGEGASFHVEIPLGAPAAADLEGAQQSVTSAGVVEQARGFVVEALRWLEEEPAGGSAARTGGPASTIEQPSTPEVVAAVTGARTDPAHRGRVLVVDDNADMRDYIARLLAAEFDVDTAPDGVAALDQVRTGRPDLVLTDVMMPRLDGFGLLQKLRSDDDTADIPVIMLSARAGEEGTIEGLEAGADDYLAKPFSARELLARVRVNMELDRVRRVRATLERSQSLLDQAERLARVGSFEIDWETDLVTVSAGLLGVLGRERVDVDGLRYPEVVRRVVHPDHQERAQRALERARETRALALETTIVRGSGAERLVLVRGEMTLDEQTGRQVLRGSVQDVTEQRLAEKVLAESVAREESSIREHAIADALQRSMLPERDFEIEHLDVATFYKAGVEGTQVGGDWYDIIELGAGRTALVIGDVMGRGVKAASGMGQLRSAVRALAKLDLPPTDVLEYLDALVQDLEGDQIVTCVYAIFDSTDQTLRFANAGHLPPLLLGPDGRAQRLEASGPPLGAGYYGVATELVRLTRPASVVLYTDGLVEQRGRDIDDGIDTLAGQLESYAHAPVEGLPETLVSALLPEGPDDDIAILVARVNADPFEAAIAHRIEADVSAVAGSRHLVRRHLEEWGLPSRVVDDIELMASELVTNAVVHGRPPIDLRMFRMGNDIVLDVQDRGTFRPRRRRSGSDDENGRGLQIVSVLADNWGSRNTGSGKSVWASRSFTDDGRGGPASAGPQVRG